MENIQDLSITDRPREKMIMRGPDKLNDTELLAILLGSGTKTLPVLALSSHLLANGLESLAEMPLDDLRDMKGIGPAKAAVIIAAMELGRRSLALANKIPKIKTEADAIRLVAPHFKAVEERLFVLVLLNKNHELLATCELKIKQPDIAHILQLVQEAGASAFGLARNKAGDNAKLLKEETKILSDLGAAASMLRLKYLGRILLE